MTQVLNFCMWKCGHSAKTGEGREAQGERKKPLRGKARRQGALGQCQLEADTAAVSRHKPLAALT